MLVAPPKAIECEGGRLQRALHSLELQAALHEIDFGGVSREYVTLAGGGLVVEAPLSDENGALKSDSHMGPSIAQYEDTMAVFVGTLTNYGTLTIIVLYPLILLGCTTF